MSQLIQLRQRILSIKKTCKITRAMRLMSMSLYSKLEKQSVAISRYRKRITTLFSEISLYAPDWKNQVLFPEDILDSNPLLIIVTSSKGLCGGFNSQLTRYFEENFFLEEHQKPTFVTIGKKGQDYLIRKNLINIAKHYDELSSANIVDISQDITDLMNAAPIPFSSVTLYANTIKNFFVQLPVKKPLIPLPIELHTNDSTQTAEQQDTTATSTTFEEEPIWEQRKEEVMDFVGTTFLKSLLLNALLESLLAEQAARFMAMDHSTTNAEKYLEKLTRQYNKSRQARITSEVAELSAGFSQVRT